MIVVRGPQGRLGLPTESPSLNKVITYFTNFTYLLHKRFAAKIDTLNILKNEQGSRKSK